MCFSHSKTDPTNPGRQGCPEFIRFGRLLGLVAESVLDGRFYYRGGGGRWCSGRASDTESRGPWFDPH